MRAIRGLVPHLRRQLIANLGRGGGASRSTRPPRFGVGLAAIGRFYSRARVIKILAEISKRARPTVPHLPVWRKKCLHPVMIELPPPDTKHWTVRRKAAI